MKITNSASDFSKEIPRSGENLFYFRRLKDSSWKFFLGKRKPTQTSVYLVLVNSYVHLF